MIDHVKAWAERCGFELVQDSGRNLVIRVPATPGREDAATLMLQGHLDMVCERDPASANDPTIGKIALVRDGEWLTADGTTLGADDGVAIAAMMALVEDGTHPHGPLELLMTVAEEVGLEGANDLDGSLLTGSTLINLDSEEDGVLTVGCAGSTDTWIRVEAPRERVLSGRGHLVAHGRGRAWRPLRRSDRARARERDQGARPRAARDIRSSAVPARVPGRRQEPERDSARCCRGVLGPGRGRSCLSRRRGVCDGDCPGRVLGHRSGRHRHPRDCRSGNGRVDGGGNRQPARRGRTGADRAACDEPCVRQPRRDEHVAR